MPITYIISKEDAEKIKALRKKINNKQVDKRLYAVELRGEGKSNKEIAEKLDTSPKVLSRWVSAYVKHGIESLYDNRKGGNHRNMSYEEALLLSGFKKASENGQIVEVSEIKKAYEDKAGHKIGAGHIYYILARHGWRKVMSRSCHPKKSKSGGYRSLKKITSEVGKIKQTFSNATVRLMFQDEAGFGRINKPKYCWCQKGIRPCVPCHHIREYRYVYGAVEPVTGESQFLIITYCNTICMNIFLNHLSSYTNIE